MFRNPQNVIAVSMFAILTATSMSAALAEPGHGKGRGHDKDHFIARGNDDVKVVIVDHDRDIIRNYLRDKNCPPGLAKKDNGCLPPGHAKRYSVGDIWVVEERPRTIWQALADMISPPPSGYRYVRTDTDVLLVSESNNRIVDIVTLD